MAYRLNLPETFEMAPETLKPAFNVTLVNWLGRVEHWYADDKWNQSETSRWSIACSFNDYQFIKQTIGPGRTTRMGGLIINNKKTGDLRGRLYFDFDLQVPSPKVGQWKIRFRVTGKTSAGGASDGKNTALQEKGSKYIFEQAVLHNKNWPTITDLINDQKTMDELRAIYPAVDQSWIESYWKQNATLQKTFSSAKWTRFDHSGDGSFMDFIKKVLRNNFGDQFSRYETWNPADIWLVKDFSYVKKQIEDVVKTNNDSKTIEALNSKLRALYAGDGKGRVIGISLKKVTKGVAQYKPYNLTEVTVGDEDGFRFKSIKYVIKLDSNMTQDSRIHLKNGSKGFTFQIKGNDSKIFSNLKWESSMNGFGAARAGKAPVDMVIKLLADSGQVFKNSHNQYPKTLDEFQVPSTAEKYASMFWKLRQYTGGDTPGVATKEAFKTNMKAKFAVQPHVANSKLMQLAFLECVCSLGTIQSEIVVDFWMDMCFLSLKKGKKFGPFGKLF